MVELDDLKDHKITVFSEKGDARLAEATVLSHDRARQMLVIDGTKFPTPDSLRATLFVEDGHKTIRCMGNIRRRTQDGHREVTIYKVQVIQDSRTSPRHSVRTAARVEKIDVDGILKPLEIPLEVSVLNISTSGIQLETTSPALDIGVYFQLVLDIAGERTAINTSVVRIVSEERNLRRLGCSFLSLG